MGRIACLLAATLALAGCASPTEDGMNGPNSENALNSNQTTIVIALIDTGVNPYRPIFRVNGMETPPVGLVPSKMFLLADQGDYQDRLEADEEEWKSTVPRELIWFQGTRLLSISFYDTLSTHLGLDRDAFAHGTMTAHLAARESPSATIIAIQVDADVGGCADDPTCLIPPGLADAMEWTADQPWIDVVSVSLAIPGNPPDSTQLHPDVTRFLTASRRAAEGGKVIVNAAGNHATATIASPFIGPPWVIAVGGIQPDADGEAPHSGKGIDIASNFTDYGPARATVDELVRVAGTSVATPIVAATIAQSLHAIKVHNLDPHDRRVALRGALNASGIAMGVEDWAPAEQITTNGSVDDLLTSTSLPILLQPQMGWGYVNSSLAPEIARRVLENDLSIPAGKAQAAIFQAEWQRAREEYWSRYA